MTTVAYCAVAPDGRTFGEQMVLSDENVPRLRLLTDAVHAQGAAVSAQLGHCGGFTKNKALSRAPVGPSLAFNEYGSLSGIPRVRAAKEEDIAELIAAFAGAARRAKEAGFDAVELHLGHGYLLSQWLSPAKNRRRDEHGGSLENRLRFPLAVVAALRAELGPEFPILAKTNLRDGFRGGLELEESIEIAKALEAASVDAIVPSGGFVNKNAFYLVRGGRPLLKMIAVEKSWRQKAAMAIFGPFLVRPYAFEETFFFDDASKLLDAVNIPIVLLGGIASRDNVAKAMGAGFEFLALGRALIADPNLVTEMQAGTKERTRCDRCNVCMTEMDRVGVRCILDDSTPLLAPAD
jgi:2,4-dienoyl-CoA reductase-like NADH-dependent reductase (Old Yellow Enzyme family)